MKEILNRIEKMYLAQKRTMGQSMYLHLYTLIKNAILNKDIPPGITLPPTRKLSEKLSISRSTVIKSYDLLLYEGYLDSKRGSGFRVKDFTKSTSILKIPKQHYEYPEISDTGKSFLNNIGLINSTEDKHTAFRPGLPPLDIFPIKKWQSLSNYYWKHCTYSDLSYYPSSGIEPLKKSLATYLNLSRQIKCDPEQIVVVSGSLQSLYLIAKALVNTGDIVCMENPTFPNVYTLFKSYNAKIQALQLDDEGAKPISFDKAEKKPKLIHVTPSGHYPRGIRMSMKRRKELLKWAKKNKAIIIENDYEHEMSLDDNNKPTVFSLDKEDRTIYLGTFNRLLHPSIRIGYMIVPYFLIETIHALQKMSHRFISPSVQFVMNQFIEKKLLMNHLDNLREVALERKYMMEKYFRQVFPSNINIVKPQTNELHLLVMLPKEIKEKKYINLLHRNNIIVHAYSKCFISQEKGEGMILGYSSVPGPAMRKKVFKMGKLFHEMNSRIGS